MNLKLASVLIVAASSCVAAEWPQFRGPNYDSTTPEKVVKWSSAPRQVWKVPCDSGFSSFAVGGGRAFTLVAKQIEGEEHETCLAVDSKSGKVLWQQDLGKAGYLKRDSEKDGNAGAPDNRGGDGPRSTPTVDGERVYVTSAYLVLYCLEAKTGKVIWQRDLLKQHEGKNISWCNAASPLLDGELIFMAGGGPGQALMAINKKDGQVVWKGEDDKMTHSTPTVATLFGVRQVIFLTQKGLVSLETKTGRLLWRYPFEFRVSTAMTPVVGGDMVYCSAGYGVGSDACKISKDGDTFKATKLWHLAEKELNSHWSTPVYKDGYIYAISGCKLYGTAPLKCIEMATGKEMWSQPGFGPGGVIRSGENLLVLGDNGELVLVQATTKAYTELVRSKVIDGKCWSTPAVSDGRIYLRSTKEGVCVEMR